MHTGTQKIAFSGTEVFLDLQEDTFDYSKNLVFCLVSMKIGYLQQKCVMQNDEPTPLRLPEKQPWINDKSNPTTGDAGIIKLHRLWIIINQNIKPECINNTHYWTSIDVI